MRRKLATVAAAALVLTACNGEAEDTTEPTDAAPAPAEPQPDEVEAEVEVEVEVEEGDPDAIDAVPEHDIFGMGFEGLWYFQDTAEVALIAEPDSDVDALMDALGEEPGVTEVEEVPEAEVQERGELDALRGPDDPEPRVLRLVADDHATATGLEDLESREEVQFAFLPSCDALAGSARHGGIEHAQELLDDAGCDELVIVDADPDAERPWVVAAGTDGDTICVAGAATGASFDTCTDDPADPGSPIMTGAGGFVMGFTPPEVEAVELEYAGQQVAVEPVPLEEGAARAYGTVFDDDTGDDEFVDAPDIGEVSWRFLDAAGEVVDESEPG